MRDKEQEVYNYVKDNVNEYLPIIIRAITDGVAEENFRLREQKSKVEAGIIVLLENVKIKKIKDRFKSVLLEAFNNSSFFKFDSFIKELKEQEKDG